MIMLGLADESQFEHLLTYMAISAGIMLVLCAIVVPDMGDADSEGLSLRALVDKAKTKVSGILYSRTGYMYYGLLGIFVTVLMICLFANSLETDTGTTALLILAALNLVLPVLTFLKLDQETIEGWANGVTDFEESLLDKASKDDFDKSFGEAA